jgi:uncharacterized zinc-type alcohol dehydrogenase-like protein
MITARGIAAHSPTSPLVPFEFERRDPGPRDVQIQVLFCGICHSDLHQAHDDWGDSIYPMVPGHEIVGRVVAVGAEVRRVRVGGHAGVGCMVDSCRQCDPCTKGLEQYCVDGPTWTYNARERGSERPTFGGYCDVIVVDESFVVTIPPGIELAAAAPLLCAGITTWSPLAHWQVGAGQKVGVIGIGGLGHMGIKFAHALGAHVVAITTSAAKAAEAGRLGADEVLLSTDAEAMARHERSFGFLLNTIPGAHDVNPYLKLLELDATMVIVGALMELTPALEGKSLIGGRRRLAGSVIGGIAETQAMLDFCGRHGIVSDVEVIGLEAVNDAWLRVARNDVRYRFVIDMARGG